VQDLAQETAYQPAPKAINQTTVQANIQQDSNSRRLSNTGRDSSRERTASLGWTTSGLLPQEAHQVETMKAAKAPLRGRRPLLTWLPKPSLQSQVLSVISWLYHRMHSDKDSSRARTTLMIFATRS